MKSFCKYLCTENRSSGNESRLQKNYMYLRGCSSRSWFKEGQLFVAGSVGLGVTHRHTWPEERGEDFVPFRPSTQPWGSPGEHLVLGGCIGFGWC